MEILLKPFAWLLLFFYNFFGSYGWALILFAFVIKMCLFPVTLKSKKSMIQTSMLSGKMSQLQRQYGKDKERYNLEVQKLYEREKVNPMGGCLWSLIPMVVLIGLYAIIREPITHFMQLSAEQIHTVATFLNWESVAVANGWVTESAMAKLVEQVTSGDSVSVFQTGAYNQMYLASMINESNLPALQTALGESNLFVMNFSFLGLDLSAIPTWKFWEGGITPSSIGMFVLPLVSTVISFLSMKVSMATNKINQQTQNAQMDRTNQMMMWTMPLMSLWIGFTLPAGLCVYWIAQYLVTMAQEVVCARLLKKDYEQARLASEKRDQEEKEEEKRQKEEARLERARRIEEEKSTKGKKKPGQKAKEVEPEQDGIHKDDSREGLRAYARGRAYIPNRFDGVTAYTDPGQMLRAQAEAEATKGKRKKDAPQQEETTVQTTIAPPVQEEETPAALSQTAPVETISLAPMEMEEIEIEVEQIEVEVDEDDNKEGV